MKKRKGILNYFMIVAGALLASFAVQCFLLPNNSIDYGTAGIAIIINKLTGINLSFLVFIVFLPFLILGRIKLGKKFFYKAILGSLTYSVGLIIFEKIGFVINTEHFISASFGGAILGLGLSLILRAGGCIDGSEIFANVVMEEINKKKNVVSSISFILIIFNACIYLAVGILFDLDSALLSLLTYVIATTIMEKSTNRFESIKKVTIVSKNCEEFAKEIKEQLNRTSTIFDSYGMISGDNKTLTCYVNYFELNTLKDIVKENENKAFVTISDVDEMYSN